ncbi:MAG: hypothetical protein Q9217_001227 [Psora testacea]
MSHNFPHRNGASHGSPPDRHNTGVQGLMSSLISPSPSTPMQSAFHIPWLGMPEWQNGEHAGFGAGTHNQVQADIRASFTYNNDEDYEPVYQDPSELEAGGTIAVATGQDLGNGSEGGAPSLRTLQTETDKSFPSTYIARSQPQPPRSTTSGTSSTPNAAENAKKLSELRAKLLAKKSKGSREASPAARGRASPRSIHSNLSTSPKAVNGARTPQPKTAMGTGAVSGQATPEMNFIKPSHERSEGGISSDLDNLFAEVRNGANNDKVEAAQPSKMDTPGAAPNLAKSAHGAASPDSTKASQRPPPARRVSSSELSDGEIRSDEEQPVAAKKTLTKTSISRKESQDSAEKSRRESEVEATYQPPPASKRDSQEKLRRQSLVQLTYSPLKKPTTSMSKPALDTTSVTRAGSLSAVKSPKPAVEPSSRPWITQAKGRGGEYDSYVPPHRGSRNPSMNEPTSSLGKRTSTGDRIDAEDRRRVVEENAKAAAAYKKTLNSRPQPSRVVSSTETTYLGRSIENRDTTTNIQGGHQQSSAQFSPTKNNLSNDPDLLDWLELTEYNDEEYRKGRLSRFRKKKELEKLRLELEQEEQLELQQRSLFRSSMHPHGSTTRGVANMAPPSLPLREANNSKELIKGTALAAPSVEPQVGTPTLKRQHAEDDTDARQLQPIDKMARVETNASASKATKDETSPSLSAPIPLEHRISRDDGHLARSYRPRSRSADRYRRRSASPDRRRVSGGFVPTCHNCGQPGHYQNTCVEPRRDGRDPYRPSGGHHRGGVSANYRGRNPQRGFQDPRSRYNSAGRSLDDDKRP